jgi:hypothetical protein
MYECLFFSLKGTIYSDVKSLLGKKQSLASMYFNFVMATLGESRTLFIFFKGNWRVLRLSLRRITEYVQAVSYKENETSQYLRYIFVQARSDGTSPPVPRKTSLQYIYLDNVCKHVQLGSPVIESTTATFFP